MLSGLDNTIEPVSGDARAAVEGRARLCSGNVAFYAGPIGPSNTEESPSDEAAHLARKPGHKVRSEMPQMLCVDDIKISN